jgi:sec-independent protein translocase protein TatC
MSNANRKHDSFGSRMSTSDHFEELRKRLIYALVGLVICTAISLGFGSQIISFIEKPYTDVMGSDTPLQTLAPSDGIIAYVRISLIAGLIISSPWVFYHLWMFAAVGLYSHEKKYVYSAAPFSAALFIGGALFFIYIVAPLILSFSIKFNQSMLGINSQFTFKNYISFITRLTFIFGIAFQTPTAIFFLNKTGLVSLKTLSRSRKYILLIIFVLAAIATPPDVVSQITLAVPLYLLFELGILISYYANRKKVSTPV